MSKTSERKPSQITTAAIKAMPPNTFIWDRGPGACPGLCARRQRSDGVVFLVRYAVAGKQRWQKLGAFGVLTVVQAREAARQMLAGIVQGANPAADREARKAAPTVAELSARYIRECEAGRILVRGGKPKRASTLVEDWRRIDCHVVPLLGDIKATELTRKHVEKMMHDIGAGKTAREAKPTRPRGISRPEGGRGVATRVVGMLQGILTWAVREGLVETNVAHNVVKFAENRRDRRLSAEELGKVGEALRASDTWPATTAATRFLCVTGWRLSEVTGLKWGEIDVVRRVATLAATKTGRSARPLSRAALDILAGLPRGTDDAFVFPSGKTGGEMVGLKRAVKRMLTTAGVTEASAHTLRHSFASIGADLQFNSATIGILIGHRQSGVTQRYSHVADSVTLAAADTIANEIGRQMGDVAPAGAVVQFRRAAG